MTSENNTADIHCTFWSKPKVKESVKFTDLEIALMEGGQSLDNPSSMPFIKSLKNTLP